MKNLVIGIIALVIAVLIFAEWAYQKFYVQENTTQAWIGALLLFVIGANRMWMWKKSKQEAE